ncbi:MAG: diaminopimelate epimerase [Gammaproteobacteria bacterium]|nr:diaminopimelate epimerase [Gammaproteobacteria bacterium]
MRLKFTKMHGLGNDFVVIDGINQSLNLTKSQINFIANRHLGIGCDQVLIVEKSNLANVDFRYRIFNNDGGEVEQCGNGARCFARFVRDKGLTHQDAIVVETQSRTIRIEQETDGQFTVNMGQPNFDPVAVPLALAPQSDHYTINVKGQQVSFGAVSIGNPHAVIKVSDIALAPVAAIGVQLESHTLFPQRVNVGFMQILDRQNIQLRVFERGVGETRACGSGACAAVVMGRQWGLLDDKVSVTLPGGVLMIQWQGERSAVYLSGPAQSVFEGQIDL